MRPKVRVYVAGPYSSNPEAGTNAAIDAGDRLLVAGLFPYVPHLSHFWNARHPHDWQTWMDVDREWLGACHALVRLPGESRGADQEVAWAKELGIQVFCDIEDCISWSRSVLPAPG